MHRSKRESGDAGPACNIGYKHPKICESVAKEDKLRLGSYERNENNKRRLDDYPIILLD
jgi:hypothetical protein